MNALGLKKATAPPRSKHARPPSEWMMKKTREGCGHVAFLHGTSLFRARDAS